MKIKDKNLETIVTITTGLLVLNLFLNERLFLVAALAISAAGLLSTYLAAKIDFLWNKLAEGLGFISSHILLTIVFYVILTPVSLLAQAMGKTSIELKRRDESYFIERDHLFEPKDFEQMW